jgi:hypothetical protein
VSKSLEKIDGDEDIVGEMVVEREEWRNEKDEKILEGARTPIGGIVSSWSETSPPHVQAL